jgi:hypothetical protein
MSTMTKPLEELMRELPPDMRQEVRNFAEFLLTKQAQRTSSMLQQNWAGALRRYRHQYSSLELERKELDWRGD